MSVNFNSLIKGSGIHSLLSHPVFFSVVITVIILFILTMSKIKIKSLSTVLWIFISTLSLSLVHKYSIEKNYKGEDDDIIKGGFSGREEDDVNIPVLDLDFEE